MMADLGIAEIRAEGRRLVEAAAKTLPGLLALADFVIVNADVLLADPAPEPQLTKDDAAVMKKALDRLSAAPVDDREREGEVLLDGKRWRVVRDTTWPWADASLRLVPVRDDE